MESPMLKVSTEKRKDVVNLISKTLVYAHRGASAVALPNTMEAYEKAWKMGVDGLTVEAVLSRDHHIMVYQDVWLGPDEKGRSRVNEHDYLELRRLDVGQLFGKPVQRHKMPCIEEVLKFAKEKDLYLNIEIKTGSPYDAGIENKLVKIVHEYGMASKVIYSSINHYSLVFIKRLHPDSVISAITLCAMVNPWEYLKLHDFDGYEPHYLSIHEKIIEKLRKRNLFVNIYTVNDRDHMERLFRAGASGIITDVPDMAIAVRESLENEKTGQKKDRQNVSAQI